MHEFGAVPVAGVLVYREAVSCTVDNATSQKKPQVWGQLGRSLPEHPGNRRIRTRCGAGLEPK